MNGLKYATFLLAIISVGATASDLHAATTIVADPMERSGGWQLTGGDWGSNGQMGFNASAGNYYWGSSWQEPAVVGIEKTFSGIKVAPGVYTLTIETMCPGDAPYNAVPLTAFSEFGLTGISATQEAVLSAPTPKAGDHLWTPWTLQYTVPTDSLDVGNPLGFKALYEHTSYTHYSVMLDNLHVTFQTVPEPSTIVLLGLGAASLFAYAWRRRRQAA